MKTMVKICGLTNVDDALAAAALGARYLGFVFAESPRRIADFTAERIIDAVRRTGVPDVRMVGVFLNRTPEAMAETARRVGLDIIQVHGDASQEDCDAMRRSGFQVTRALQIRDAVSVEQLAAYDVDYYLCDAWHPRLAGGTGQQFDHALIRDEAKRRRLFLAGGLNPENVAEAICCVRPFAVDVSSGVEGAQKGVKDHDKLRLFFQSVEHANES
jgi:phosphoribosylanthranilate isomerase